MVTVSVCNKKPIFQHRAQRRMNDPMKVENRFSKMPSQKSVMLGLLVGFAWVAQSGCRGTPLSFPQSLSGGASSRVPPPATGSFQVPGNYSGSSTPSSTGLGSSSFSPSNSVSGSPNFSGGQTPPPISDFVNGITSAQSKFRTATNNAVGAVNRAADDLNSRVENATARVDRFGEGVKQASAILNDAATSPPLPPSFAPADAMQPGPTPFPSPSNGFSSPSTSPSNTLPSTSMPSSGRIGDGQVESAGWRSPNGN